MSEIILMKVADVKINDKNPRFIRDVKYEKLLNSIREFPEMLHKRPIVVDENYIALGGNMRLRACKELKLKEIPVMIAKGWTVLYLLSESHFAIHTFPEHGKAYIELSSCVEKPFREFIAQLK